MIRDRSRLTMVAMLAVVATSVFTGTAIAGRSRLRPPGDDPHAPRTASRTSSPPTSPASASATATRAAKDNICVLADTYVTVNGERSRWFGPDASYIVQGGNGATNNNLNSDFFYQRIKDNGTIEDLLALEPPRGPRPEIKEAVRGYVAGYNRYLRDTGVDNIPDPRCRGKPWVRPITEMDAYRRFYQLGLIASQGVAIDGIGGAQPPTGAGPTPPTAADAGADDRASSASSCRSAASARTPRPRHATRPTTAAAWCSATRTSRGTARSASTSRSSRSRARSTSSGGEPVRRAGHQHRPHRQPRLEPHRLDRVPLHAVRAEARAGLAAPPTSTTASRADEGRGRDRHGARTPTARSSTQTRTLYSTPPRARSCTRSSDCRCSRGRPPPRGRWATRTRGNFRYLNHFFEVNQAQSVERAERHHRAQPGRPVGEHARRRLDRATPSTPTSRSSRT